MEENYRTAAEPCHNHRDMPISGKKITSQKTDATTKVQRIC